MWGQPGPPPEFDEKYFCKVTKAGETGWDPQMTIEQSDGIGLPSHNSSKLNDKSLVSTTSLVYPSPLFLLTYETQIQKACNSYPPPALLRSLWPKAQVTLTLEGKD